MSVGQVSRLGAVANKPSVVFAKRVLRRRRVHHVAPGNCSQMRASGLFSGSQLIFHSKDAL